MESGILQRTLPRKLSQLGTADAVLALGVIAIVGLMIVPLPTWLLDILLAFNISLSVGILLVVLYVPNALAIATFPTLLLITTLLRLSLNVSSSRLILLQANAGEVIRAFGNFVVRGNYVVGAVIFLILTVIQFVVIAKGSERVAEVAARFALDAMPGKQMAIDAEMRAGTIDVQQAQRRRHQLARESQFYGAMDGAMKFVKGDVIASLVITAVNILGGLLVGILQRNMDVGAALKRYGLLTIGDGLVTQIPALVLATSAGILVTRVASEDENASLGQELSAQLFATPKAIQVSGVFVVALAIVPGLPTVPFLLIGSCLLVVARVRTKQLEQRAREQERLELRSHAQPVKTSGQFVPVVTPWALHIAPDLHELVQDYASDHHGPDGVSFGLRSRLLQLREHLFAELGVPLPSPVVRVSEQLPEGRVVLSLFEVPFQAIDVSGATDDTKLQAIELFVLGALRRRAADFIGIQETQWLLDQLEQVAPSLPRQVVPKPISLPLLTDILARLVEEGIGVRNLRAILQALATATVADKDPLALTEMVRSHLKRATTFQLTGGSSTLEALMLDAEIEDIVREGVQHTASGSFLALAPSVCRDIVEAITAHTKRVALAEGRPLVLLTQPDVRRFVRKLTEIQLPDMRVVSYAELLPETSLQSLGHVTIQGPPL